MYFSPDDSAKMLHAHCTLKDQGVQGQPSYVEVADLLEHHFRYQHWPKNVMSKIKILLLVFPQRGFEEKSM